MKKTIKNTMSKILFLLSFALISIPALANSGEVTEGIDYGLLVRMPQFWAAVVLFIGFVTASLLVGRQKNETEIK